MGPLVFIGMIATILWVIPCYICYEQGKPKHRRGLAWGICLGWLGVVALAVLPAGPERPRFLDS